MSVARSTTAQLMTFFCFRFPEVLFGSPRHDLHLPSITLNLLSPQLSFFMVLKCDLFGLNNIYSDKVHDIHKYNVKIVGSDSKLAAYLDHLLDML